MRLIFNSTKSNTGPITVDCFFDPDNFKFYEANYDNKTQTYVRGRELNIKKNPLKFNRTIRPVKSSIKPTGNNDVILNGNAN